jgi:integral membrane protein (TIGR01906 family)
VYRLLLSTLIYAFVYSGLSYMLWLDKRRVALALVSGSVLTLGVVIILGLMISLNFESFFYQFHLLSFTNDLWLLDPATDYLIMLFPQGFWYDAAIFITLGTTAMALILGGSGWWRLRQEKRAEQATEKAKAKKQPAS